MDILSVTTNKVNFLNDEIKVIPDDNMYKAGSSGTLSFMDLLLANQMEATADTSVKEDGIADQTDNDLLTLEGLLSQEDIRQMNPEVFEMLKEILSVMQVMQGIEANGKGADAKADIIARLQGLLSKEGVEGKDKELMAALEKTIEGGHKDQGLIAGFEAILLVIEEGQDGKGADAKADIIARLQGLLSKEGVEGKDKELMAALEKTIEGGHKDQGLIAGLEAILRVMQGIEANGKGADAKADIIARLQGLLSKGGVEGKDKELMAALEKTIAGLKNHEKDIKDIKIEKNNEGDADKDLLKTIVEKLDGYRHERGINDKNLEKRHVVYDKVSNDLNSVKVSDKNKGSVGHPSNPVEEVSLENDAVKDVRLSKDGKNTDTQGSDRDIKIVEHIKTSISQNAKNGLTDQRQNKDKLGQQGKDVKSDSNKLLHIEADRQIVGDKAQNLFKSEIASQSGKASPSAHTISQSQLGEMVVHGAKQFIKGGNSEIHLTIKKPDLGNIKISFIEKGNGKLEVVVMAERREASDLIRQSSAEIKQLLFQEGIDLSRFDVFDPYDRNKRHLAQENGSQKNYRRNRFIEGAESAASGETLAQNDDLSVQGVGTLSINEQVNVFA